MELKARLIAFAGLCVLSASILAAGERLSHLAEIAVPEIIPESIPEIPSVENEAAPIVSTLQKPEAPGMETQEAIPDKPASNNAAPSSWTLTLLHQPVISSLTDIRADRYRIILAGIAPLDSAQQCGPDNHRWPCGRFAVTAFRHFVRGRAIRCNVPQQPSNEAITTQCFIGKDDLAAWLAANGWASALDDEAYGSMAQAAIKSQRGRYSPPPQ